MERYTAYNEGASSAPFISGSHLSHVDNGFTGEAADRLARLESLYEALAANQDVLAKELETLRLAGKTRTTKFQQLMAKKLTEKNVMILLDIHVFDDLSDGK